MNEKTKSSEILDKIYLEGCDVTDIDDLVLIVKELCERIEILEDKIKKLEK